MSEKMTAGIRWRGRGEHATLASIATSVDDAREMLEKEKSEGLVDKNAGEFYGSIAPDMTPEQFRDLMVDDDRMDSIARGEDEEFVVDEILGSYEVTQDDWHPDALTKIYPEGSEGEDVFIR